MIDGDKFGVVTNLYGFFLYYMWYVGKASLVSYAWTALGFSAFLWIWLWLGNKEVKIE